ncbi:MAG: hypothetical protein ACYTHM_17520 [Planctomycetota bacterium]
MRITWIPLVFLLLVGGCKTWNMPERAAPPRAPAVRGAVPAPGERTSAGKKKRPRIELTPGGWAAIFRGSATGHWDWGTEEIRLRRDLDLKTGVGQAFDITLRFPRGPRFRIGTRNFTVRSEVPADRAPLAQPSEPPDPGEPLESGLDMLSFDIGFCPLIWEARWGSIFLETGLRYIHSQIDVGTESPSSFAEGFQATLSGELRFPLYRRFVFGDGSILFGLGPDASAFESGVGLDWRPHPNFRIRLGLRYITLRIRDRVSEPDKRELTWTGLGPHLELGFNF